MKMSRRFLNQMRTRSDKYLIRHRRSNPLRHFLAFSLFSDEPMFVKRIRGPTLPLCYHWQDLLLESYTVLLRLLCYG